MRLTMFAALSLCAAIPRLSAAQSSRAETILRAHDDGGEVTVDEQHVLSIQLTAIPGTGARWEVTGIDSRLLRNSSVESMHDAPMPGAPETFVLRFEGLSEGDSVLRLEYRRPWLPRETPPAKSFAVRVHTKGPFAGRANGGSAPERQ